MMDCFNFVKCVIQTALIILTIAIIAPAYSSGLPPRGADLNDLGSPDDHEYQHGKSIFNGRNLRYGRIKYCVTSVNGNGIVKLKKKTLKPFANGSKQDLAKNLYDCEQPIKGLEQVMQEADMFALVYYLNKRHNLDLN